MKTQQAYGLTGAGASLRRSVSLLFVLWSLTFHADAEGEHLRGELALHDPSTIVKCDGNYWVFATGRGIVSRYSPDLVEWRTGPPVFNQPPAWTTNSVAGHRGRFWAPDVIHDNGRYLLYYSVSTWGSRNSAIGLATNPTLNPSSPGYQWQDRGVVIRSSESDDFNAIDPSVMQDAGGRLWLAFGSFWSGIKLVELDPKTGLRLSTNAPLQTLAWKDAIEAPCLHRHGDSYYLFVNWGLCCHGTNSTYNIRVGRSANVLGPYLDQDGVDLARGGGTLVLQTHGYRVGPGHAGILDQGPTTWFSYHFYDARSHGTAMLDLQPLRWNSNGWPEVVAPAADSIAPKPLYRDPVYDGAADPVVVWNPHLKRWWMFYTNRRANLLGLSGVTWVHGTRIGIAESADDGATWKYTGTADIELPVEIGGTEPTHWAPEVFTGPDGTHHMFLSLVPGVFEDWNHPRTIVHLTSVDLRKWSRPQPLKLASDRVIDACVLRLPNGTWRLWYNNERDRKSIYYADSPDLVTWQDRGKAVGDQAGEGPKVFRWRNLYWMVTDVWRGLAVYRSDDAVKWTRQPANLVEKPGHGTDDEVKGGHPDVVVSGNRVFLFYFTHPGRRGADERKDGYEQRRSSIQVVELELNGQSLTCDRDRPTRIQLLPPFP